MIFEILSSIMDSLMSNNKPKYELRNEDELLYKITARTDAGALEVTMLEVINKEGNFNGLELYKRVNGRKMLIAKFEPS